MAYFFYGLDRFSVDLDFDLLKEKQLPHLKKELPKILLKYGEITDAYDKKFTLFYLLNYKKGVSNIKIEISKRQYKNTSYNITNFYGTDVKISSKSDSLAAKMVAVTQRKNIASRDFYDINFYLKKGVIPNEQLIMERTQKSLQEYLNYLIHFTEKNLNSSNVLKGLGELIDKTQKQKTKVNLKNELLGRLEVLKRELN